MDSRCIRFTDLETVYQLFLMLEEFEDEVEKEMLKSIEETKLSLIPIPSDTEL